MTPRLLLQQLEQIWELRGEVNMRWVEARMRHLVVDILVNFWKPVRSPSGNVKYVRYTDSEVLGKI